MFARRPIALALLAVAASHPAFGATASGGKPVFLHPFDGQPIEVPLKDGEPRSKALEHFRETGENDYRGDADAQAEGKQLYDQWCQVCHNADATGKMGPALIGDRHVYPQTANDVGMFAIIYAGASGAMQAFADRLSQDEILKIIAYIRSLEKK